MEFSTVSCSTAENIIWQLINECSFDDEVAVFRFCLPDDMSDTLMLESLLEEDERTRAYRFHRQVDCYRFVYAKALLRLVAGKYINLPPREVRFSVGKSKKPELDGQTGWHMNVSHSGQWILLAFARKDIGVDIEQINSDFDWRDVADYSFSRQEQKSLIESDDTSRQFYRLWTRKEALLKATGKGVDEDFSNVPALDGIHSVRSILLGMAGNWSVISFPTAHGCLSAIAVNKELKFPKFYTLDSGFISNFES